MGVEAKDAFTSSVQSNAHGTETVRAPAPEPKVNHGPFSKGYTDGYTGNAWNDISYETHKERMAYDAGYDAGTEDREDGTPERYRYEAKAPAGWTRNADGKVTPPPGTVFKAQSAAWPFPTKG
jgi:ribosome modulation factor